MAFVAPALPMIAAAGAIGSAGLSAYGAIQGGRATRDAQNYKAAVAMNNKVVAEQNAEGAINAGVAKGQAQGLKGRAVGGAIKAKQAASGVDVNSGSNVDVQEAQAEQSRLDVETVLHNADLAAYGYRTQATNFEAEAVMDKAAGEQAEKAGYIKAGTSLLGAASSLGWKWGGMGENGTPSPFTGREPTDI